MDMTNSGSGSCCSGSSNSNCCCCSNCQACVSLWKRLL